MDDNNQQFLHLKYPAHSHDSGPRQCPRPFTDWCQPAHMDKTSSRPLRYSL
ncbi:unnamed protein product, partial [Gulo gulo]